MKPTPSKASHFILGKWSTFTAATLGSMALLFATPQSEPSGDREIADYLQMNIKTDELMEDSAVSVRLDGGVAKLTGEARSLSQVERASTWAYTIQGVLTVVNQIEIKPAAPASILAQAKSVFSDQKLITANKVKVETTGTRVTLKGQVGTWDESDLARELVSEIPGVTAIDNKITVDFEGLRSDAQIAAQLGFMVRDDPAYVGLDLVPSVRDGVVKWNGNIGSNDELSRLVRNSYVTGAVEVVSKQVHINSDLRLEGLEDKEYTPDQAIEALTVAIKNDSRFNPGSIKFSLKEGVFVLKGQVNNLSESDAVELNAGAIPGILRVNNQLRVAKNEAIVSNDR
ncbi:MAG: BON domain-containing protein [Verrucomicrobiota bacterium]